MWLACSHKIPPTEWNHNPNIQNDYRMTTAMYLARSGIIPPI